MPAPGARPRFGVRRTDLRAAGVDVSGRTLAPLRVVADLRRRPWGGDRLRHRWGPHTAPPGGGDEPVGEAWLAGPASRIEGGPDAGRTLDDFAAEHGAAFVGTTPFARYGGRMPLLVKLLDAAAPLSVQVHPDDGYARREERASGDLGKTEAWWVLDAAPGAVVQWGFRREVSRDEIARAVERGDLSGLLTTLPAAAGDVVVNVAGTVHALGAGLLVYEVQQASDLTYRLFDHGRTGPDGRPRTLHLRQALDVSSRTPGTPAGAARPTGAGRTELARTHAFVLERIDGVARATWTVGPASLEVLTNLGDEAALLASSGEAWSLPAWASAVVPAGTGEVSVEGAAILARTWCPEPRG